MSRRLFILAVALLTWGGSLVLFAMSWTARAEDLRGVENPTQAAALPYVVPRFGVNAELTAYDEEQLDAQLALMEEAGVTWVRQYFYWDKLEPTQGEFVWAEADRIFAALAQHPDLQLIAVLQNSPAWAIDPQAVDPTGPPRNPADFAAFVAAFAERYGANVTYYQIWDEPNLFTNWGRLQPRAVRYAALLEGAYKAIHNTDPDAVVISAALAPTIETGPDNISDWIYLRDLYTFGVGDFFDAVGAKPYGFDFSPENRRVEARFLNFSRVIGLRDIMREFDDGDKAIWSSHWGWNHLPEDWGGAKSIWGEVNQKEQIRYTLEALDRVDTEWPWMAGMILHHWNPPYPADHPQQGFALVTPDGQPTPLLDALIQRPRPLAAAQIGWHPAMTPHAEYSGVWTFTESGADIGWLRDSRLAFEFEGDSVGLMLRQDNYVANLYVWVDGQPANALPRDAAGNAHLTLTSGSLLPEVGVVTVARDLPDGVHRLEIIADQGFDRYALIGFAVGGDDTASAYHAQTNVAGLTVLVTTLAVIFTAAGLPWGEWNNYLARVWRGLNWPLQLAITALTSLAIMVGTLLTWGQELPAVLRREPVLPVIALVSIGLVYVNIALPITLGALAVLFWCIYHRLWIGLALTVIFAPFFLFPVELTRFFFPVAEIVLGVTTGAWALRGLVTWGQMRRRGERLNLSLHRLSLADMLVIAYVALGALAVMWSTYTDFALTEYRTLFIEPALFYIIYRTANLTLLDRQRLVMALIIAGIAVSGISFVQYLRGETIITAEDASRRLAGIYGSPNNLALFLGRVIPFVFAALIAAKSARTRWLALPALALMGLTALLTQSVGGLFIGIPAALAVVLIFAWGKRGLVGLAVVAVLVIGGFAVAASQSDRFARALDFSQGTNFYRVRVMQSAWQAIQDRPLTGLGLDQFLYAFRDSYIYPDAWPEPNLSHPHNILLDFWVRLGLGGVLLFGGFLTACVMSLRRAYHVWRGQPFWGWAVLGAMGALTDTLIHGLLDNSIFVPDLAIVFFMLLALISSLEGVPSYGKLPSIESI